jgi:hypothetical protein
MTIVVGSSTEIGGKTVPCIVFMVVLPSRPFFSDGWGHRKVSHRLNRFLDGWEASQDEEVSEKYVIKRWRELYYSYPFLCCGHVIAVVSIDVKIVVRHSAVPDRQMRVCVLNISFRLHVTVP